MTTTAFEEAKKRYNRLMNDLALEHLTIGERLSEDTAEWNIRDMVSECQYQLNVCYEDENANADGRSISEMIDRYGYDEDSAREEHKRWLSKTMRLRNFIRKYRDEALKETCTMGHCSVYD